MPGSCLPSPLRDGVPRWDGRSVTVAYAPDPDLRGVGGDLRTAALCRGLAGELSVAEAAPSPGGRAGPAERARAAARGVPPRFASRRGRLPDVPAGRLVVAGTLFTVPLLAAADLGRTVLDAPNVESDVGRQLAGLAAGRGRRAAYRATAAWMERYERRTAARVAAVWACSPQDAEWFRGAGARHVHVVPNGVDPPRATAPLPEHPTAVFVASLDAAFNRQGLEWLLAAVWPLVRARIPDARLEVVGSGSALPPAGDGVAFRGRVEQLSEVYAGARAAVVPLLAGSGTRLKAVEALAHGRPVVSTRKGVEGLDLQDGRDVLVADDPGRFAGHLVALLGEDTVARTLASAASAAAERYTWSAAASEAARCLREHLTPGGLSG